MMTHPLENLNLRHLRMIQSVGKMGGVSNASRTLYTSQPAITHALAKFEDRLGFRLFKRAPRGCYPTQRGQYYLLRIDRFLETLDNAIARILSQPVGRRDERQQVDRLITGSQLRSLIALSDQKSTDGFPHEPGVSPASLRRSVRRLECALATPLIKRSSRGLEPNYKGHFLAGEFRRAIREFESLPHESFSVVQDGCDEVVVGVLPFAGAQILAEATHQFRSLFPFVRVRLISGSYQKLFADLTSNRIDIVVGTLRRGDDASLISREVLMNDNYCVVARPEHPLTQFEEVMPAEIAYFQWVGPPNGSPRRARIDRIFHGLHTAPDFFCETTSHSISRQLLLSSDMLTLAARSSVQYDLTHGILSELHCPFFDDTVQIGISMRREWQPSAAHSAFIGELRAATLQLTNQACQEIA
ncbi:LysR family transcriptional regulator [Pantoea cypripedii]|uniref:HTH lysR-type domain-containing protein n=1 Tax=Pantoea cypripedii TaxID=55209 RepID=A0A6B9G692_PANCY|nr:LysR family transcriptional regulator [Pantoea cypripedii]QGY33094.1 hypothetical protein CUN67_29695 [Pantoea cypripedii]